MSEYLSVVGNISGAHRKTHPNVPEMPNFPIILRTTTAIEIDKI